MKKTIENENEIAIEAVTVKENVADEITTVTVDDEPEDDEKPSANSVKFDGAFWEPLNLNLTPLAYSYEKREYLSLEIEGKIMGKKERCCFELMDYGVYSLVKSFMQYQKSFELVRTKTVMAQKIGKKEKITRGVNYGMIAVDDMGEIHVIKLKTKEYSDKLVLELFLKRVAAGIAI